MDLKPIFDKFVLPTYNRLPIQFVKGKGVRLWDDKGASYLDFFSGWAVSNLGHCHPHIVKTIQDQVENLIHVPNIFYNETQGILAQKIAENSWGGKTFFCNSGAEANEAAIKLARKRTEDKYECISLLKSFHGRTFGAMSMTGQAHYKENFKPLPNGFLHCEPNNIEQLKSLVTNKTAAIFLECIQGEGGINILDKDFIQEARNLCYANNALLVFDEVQTGMGRTGKMFSYEHHGIEPDMMTLAKALGGGVAIGALVVKSELDSVLTPGTHASTFGGNPLACSAGIAVFEVMEKDNILDHVQKMHTYIIEKLKIFKEKYDLISDVRGLGLMIGIELKTDEGQNIFQKCCDRKLLINCTQKNVLRLMPALNIEKRDIDEALDILDQAFAS
ncbi:acetylornithine aminotransferase [PVC group bacterium (ex Bugula neritina AB1)]|nr:acetylornithine aminotransferase [PVC group bacterium (ex Bugula neritina AB1)]